MIEEKNICHLCKGDATSEPVIGIFVNADIPREHFQRTICSSCCEKRAGKWQPVLAIPVCGCCFQKELCND